MKKTRILALLLALVMVLAFAGCGNKTAEEGSSNEKTTDVKIGVILVGDENEGYTYAHIDGIKKAAEELNFPADQIIWKYTVPEDESCYDAAADLADKGCSVVFSNSYGHQSYMVQAAEDFPEVTFVSMTGDTAAVCGLDNVCNAFTKVFQSRYVSGVVAGMKLAELEKDGKLSAANFNADGKIKIGYVGAFPYAEVVSGYTAFFLGIKSVVENVSMEVTYTNSWFDITAEGEAANMLVADGCVIIGQHADSTGAPAAVQANLESGKVCYSVGYNVDMLEVAPDAALTSATNTWSVYYKYALGCAMNGEKIVTNWAHGYDEGAVAITKLGNSCAEGTAEKVAEVEAAIKDGSLKVFDISKFTVGGKTVESHKFDFSTMNADYSAVLYKGPTEEVIVDGCFDESSFRSAPYFDLRIDGIVELQ